MHSQPTDTAIEQDALMSQNYEQIEAKEKDKQQSSEQLKANKANSSKQRTKVKVAKRLCIFE